MHPNAMVHAQVRAVTLASLKHIEHGFWDDEEFFLKIRVEFPGIAG